MNFWLWASAIAWAASIYCIWKGERVMRDYRREQRDAKFTALSSSRLPIAADAIPANSAALPTDDDVERQTTQRIKAEIKRMIATENTVAMHVAGDEHAGARHRIDALNKVLAAIHTLIGRDK